jgi:hypothetical protein
VEEHDLIGGLGAFGGSSDHGLLFALLGFLFLFFLASLGFARALGLGVDGGNPGGVDIAHQAVFAHVLVHIDARVFVLRKIA